MKIALLGKGKTGSHILEYLIENQISHTVFDSIKKPTFESLQKHDVIISFLTGDIFQTYLPLLLQSKIPVVCGSTGFQWPSSFNETLIHHKIPWIYATNFSLAMNLLKQMILILKNAEKVISHPEFRMEETHHTSKLDAPSGTALSWKAWFGKDIPILSFRKDEVMGIHEFIMKSSVEEISLKHTVSNRKIFAEGAIFAAKKIRSLSFGLHLFEDVVQKEFFK